LERFVMELAAQGVVGDGRTGRVACDRESLDDGVRVVAQDVAILARTRLRLVGIAQDVFLPRHVARHERPLEPGRETRTTAPAQRTLLELVDDRRRIRLLGEDLLPRLVTTHLAIGVERPRLLVMQRRVDDLVFLWGGTV